MILPIIESAKSSFSLDLYEEHIVECGFLLAQRAQYFTDATIEWPRTQDLEVRIFAHLHGLIIGGKLASECAQSLLAEKDEDRVLGAVFALASLDGDEAGIQALIKAFDSAAPELLWCFIEGCRHGQRADLASHLHALFGSKNPITLMATIEILSYRRQLDLKTLWPLLQHKSPDVRQSAISAYARYGQRDTLPAVEASAYVNQQLPDDCVLPALCLGSNRTLQSCRSDCSQAQTTSATKLLALAIAGNEQDYHLLLNALSYPNHTIAALYAIGIHGHRQAIPQLIRILHDHIALRADAAHALDFITGAGLRETVDVSERDEEISTPQALGDAATASDTTIIVRRVQRVCTDPMIWTQWWEQHQSRFQANTRYRGGTAFELGCCVTALNDTSTPNDVRRLSYLELLIRSGVSIAFEPDWFVKPQWSAISQLRSWWNSSKDRLSGKEWIRV